MRSWIVATKHIGQVAVALLALVASRALASPVSLATVGAVNMSVAAAVRPPKAKQPARKIPPPQEIRPVVLPGPDQKPTAGSTPAVARYRIHAGDTLELKIIGRPELTQAVTVAPDGTISYPYVGELNVLGSSSGQVKARMELILKRQMVSPQVLVSILKRQMGQVSVIGPVKEPGRRELGDDWHVLHLLAASGGLTVERPEFVTMRLVRRGGQTSLAIDPVQLYGTGDPQSNVALEDGDLLVIQERDKSETMVSVLGEVNRPGLLPCPRDGSPLSVLAAAGGGTGRAALSRAVIRRGASGSPIAIDLSSPELLGPGVQIGPGDTLIVPANIRQVMVSGGVMKPGPVSLPEKGDITLFWAVQQAGGSVPEADLKHVVVVHTAPTGTLVRSTIDLEKILKNQSGTGKAAQEAAKLNLVLQSGDAVTVPIKGRRRSSGLKFGLNEMMMGLSTYLMVRQIR